MKNKIEYINLFKSNYLKIILNLFDFYIELLSNLINYLFRNEIT